MLAFPKLSALLGCVGMSLYPALYHALPISLRIVMLYKLSGWTNPSSRSLSICNRHNKSRSILLFGSGPKYNLQLSILGAFRNDLPKTEFDSTLPLSSSIFGNLISIRISADTTNLQHHGLLASSTYIQYASGQLTSISPLTEPV
jgi:hypothetical protein